MPMPSKGQVKGPGPRGSDTDPLCAPKRAQPVSCRPLICSVGISGDQAWPWDLWALCHLTASESSRSMEQALGWEPRSLSSVFEELTYHSKVAASTCLQALSLSFVPNLLCACGQVRGCFFICQKCLSMARPGSHEAQCMCRACCTASQHAQGALLGTDRR